MNLRQIFAACRAVTQRALKNSPQGAVRRKDGSTFTYQELKQALIDLEGWCYSGSCDVRKVTLCKNCKQYKRYKRKEDKFTKGTYLCALDKRRKDPEHFCGFGEEKEE